MSLELAVFAGFAVLASLRWWLGSRDRAYYRAIDARKPLTDSEFFDAYYARSEVPAEIVCELREIYCRFLGCDPGRLHPLDLDPVLDEQHPRELLQQIEKQFHVKLAVDELSRMDGSFDSFAQVLARKEREGFPIKRRRQSQ